MEVQSNYSKLVNSKDQYVVDFDQLTRDLLKINQTMAQVTLYQDQISNMIVLSSILFFKLY